jgi:regulator of CtrA degradation
MSYSLRSHLTPKLIDSLYTEAMLLADESRAYFDKQGRDQRLALDPLSRVGFSCESLKVTTRLMHVVAWLLTQRAMEAGELSREASGSSARRLGEPIESDPVQLDKLPETALALVHASQELYARVKRLEQGSTATEPQASPARSLLSRLERAF